MSKLRRVPSVGQSVGQLVAAGAAVAGSAAAHAAVVTSPINLTPDSWTGGAGHTEQDFPVDIDGDSLTEFKFTHTTDPAVTGIAKIDVNGHLTLTQGTSSAFVAIVKDADAAGGVGNYAEVLAPGTTIGPEASPTPLAAFIDLGPSSGSGYDSTLIQYHPSFAGALSRAAGELVGSGPWYLGFVFAEAANPANLHYGYFEITSVVDEDVFDIFIPERVPFLADGLARITISQFAYETDPNTPITIPTTALPEPATMGVLAASGVMSMRRRRAK